MAFVMTAHARFLATRAHRRAVEARDGLNLAGARQALDLVVDDLADLLALEGGEKTPFEAWGGDSDREDGAA